MNPFTEDTLVQRTTADYLHDHLGWDLVYAYNEETFGPEGTLGRRTTGRSSSPVTWARS